MADLLLPIGGVPLTIFAGVPGTFLNDALADAKRHYQHQGGYSLRRIEILSGLRGAQYRAHIIGQTLKTVTKYVVQKRIDALKKKKNASTEQEYSPNHVSIIFLESDSGNENELLLQNFFPFAHCIKINKIETPWAEVPLDDLLALFYQAVDNMPLWGSFQGMACWALPIRNFLYPGPSSLQEVCLQRIQNVPSEPPIIKSIINHKKCVGERTGCPNCPSRSTEVPCDDRGLCFVRGTHGKARASEELPSEKVLLDALYRFGHPLNDSVHFDTQFPKGREIMEEMFECVMNGRVPAKNTGRRAYVNIYPDDFVRVPKK